jgi:lipopolysaccharide transport system permease protein
MKKDELKVTIYEPNYRSKIGWFRTWIILIKNAYNSKDIIYQLFKKDFLMKYRKSFLGMGWLIIAPIMGIVSWVFMNATGVLKPGDVGIPYPAYVLLSTTIYGLFRQYYSGAASTLQTGQTFIMQVSFHRDALLFKQFLQQSINFLITFTVTLIVLLLFEVYPDWKIIFFPFLVMPLFFLGASIGIIVSLIKVVVPDIVKAVNFAMTLLMYITPVIYSADQDDPLLQEVMKWNPLTYLFGAVRDIIVYGQYEHFNLYLYCSLASFIIFLIAWRLFYITEEKVIEKMI